MSLKVLDTKMLTVFQPTAPPLGWPGVFSLLVVSLMALPCALHRQTHPIEVVASTCAFPHWKTRQPRQS
jgi:hypothetical protein